MVKIAKIKTSMSLDVEVMNWLDRMASQMSIISKEKKNVSKVINYLVKCSMKKQDYLKYCRIIAKEKQQELMHWMDIVNKLHEEVIELHEKQEKNKQILISH